MMGRQSRQMAMIFVDMESLIPENHLLRKVERMVSFDFIYDLLAPYYPETGRPSVDPVSMFKMLLIGYLYGIKSERRLVEEVQFNIAYRWFCGFELDDAIPDHSTFSKTRTRKWQQSDLFQKAFYEIVKQGIAGGLIDGKTMVADGSYIPANVSRESWIDVEIEVEQSTYHRLNCNKSTGKYLRCYQVEGDTCIHCPKRTSCFDKAGIRRRVLASNCYPAFFGGHQRVGTPEYLSMMRFRKI